MDERGFLFPDVERILKNGVHDWVRDSLVGGLWRYRMSGTTVDGTPLAVAVEVEPDIVIITVIG